jgi:ABC-type multidrug transport system fused ATPase/permease subunit
MPSTTDERTLFVRGVRVIASYVRTHPLPFAAAVTGAGVYALATVASTVVLGRVTDRLIIPAFHGHFHLATAIGAAVAVLAVAVIKAGGIMTRRYFAGMTKSRNEATLRNAVANRYQVLPLAYHRARPTGELLAHAESDVDAATEVISGVPYSLAVLFLIVFAAVELIVTDPFLAAVGLLVLPTLAFLNRLYGASVEGPATRVQERVGELSSVAHESFDGALVVKALGRERAEVERLSEHADRLRVERLHVGRIRANFEPALDALPNLGIIVLLAVGSWRVSTGAVSTGTLVQIVSLFTLMAFPMRLIGYVLSDMPRAVVSRARLQEVLDATVPPVPAGESLDLPDGPLPLSVRSVLFAYEDAPDVPVLADVGFELDPGTSVAIVGATGAGKSTLAQLLVRLADPLEGSVRLGGVDLRHVLPAQLRDAASLVFQESFLFAASVADNIALGQPISEQRVRWAAELARADEFIVKLPDGYDTIVGERGLSLSGGQRQRVALARALARRPRLLILDDATSAVDPTVEAEILAGLRDELQTTLVIVAYRVSTIALADRVLFLDDGRIAASGTHRELLSYPAYESMVRAYERSVAP